MKAAGAHGYFESKDISLGLGMSIRGRLLALAIGGVLPLGDTIEWSVPSGLRRIKVAEILYQPEAAGDYEL